MTYLIDTNVISEGMRRRPDERVVSWLAAVDEDAAYLSAMTVSEVRYGIERLPSGRRRSGLDTWLTVGLVERFASHVLPVDLEVADMLGRVLASCEARGRPVRGADAAIAATGLCHELTVVTRNVRDFEATGVMVLNPWEAP